MTLGKDPAILEGIESEFVGSGLVFGKFMPPTNGHLHFIEFARQSCRKLTIMVCSLPNEPIPGEVRYQWIKELFPDCNVVHHYAEIAQAPTTTPEDPSGAGDIGFFKTWRDSIHRHCPGEKFDALFASEDYGFRMADVMGIKFIPVDIRRELVPISGTEMRQNPMKNWEHLHPVIRPYFAKRIALLGLDSDAKAELSQELAAHFQTVHVGEYASSYLAECERQMPGYMQNHFNIKDISTVARGQMASEDSLARQANRLIMCDSELLTSAYQSKYFFNGQCPAWVSKLAQERRYDFYLLLDPRGKKGEKAVCEGVGLFSLEEKIKFFEYCQQELDRRGLAYAVIDGNDLQEGFGQSCKAIYHHLKELNPVAVKAATKPRFAPRP